jgi:hypothetical protein
MRRADNPFRRERRHNADRIEGSMWGDNIPFLVIWLFDRHIAAQKIRPAYDYDRRSHGWFSSQVR